MAAWRQLYFTTRTYEPDPAKSAAWNRGAYLVEGLGHCSSCHSPRNRMGAIEKDRQFAGAGIDGWFALNLTSDIATGLGTWTAAEIAAYLPANVFKVILEGIPKRGTYAAMPGFAKQLNDQQIADLANDLRASFGNSAPANASVADINNLR